MTTLATRLPKPLHRQLRLYCVQRGVTMQEVVEAAVRERLRGTAMRAKRKTRRAGTTASLAALCS
jgi:hypothetical protein